MVQQSFQGQYRWLVKDPISLRYFHLSDEECSVLKMLNGVASIAEIKKEIEKKFPPRIASYEQLQLLLHRFCELGLVFGEPPAHVVAAKNARRTALRRRWLEQVGNPLFIKFPGVDPEPVLRWLYPRVRWIFTPGAALVCATLVLTAITLIAIDYQAFASNLPPLDQLFRASNFVWFMAAIAIAKVLHELGHALTCKHYGGECHEIGVALLLFAPCLYCDTTDSWMIPSKWKRAAVGAAGMAVELVLASICVLIWRFSQPSLVHYLSLNLVLVCCVSTLIFNGNPLLRYDGYYIFSDLLEVPNLWQTSRATLTQFLQSQLLGLPTTATKKSPRQRAFLIIYALASHFYRWAITIGIIVFLAKALRPYGLQAVGSALLVLVLAGICVMPIRSVSRSARRPDVWRRFNRARVATSLLIALTLVAGFLALPVPHHVMAPFVLEQRDAERIYITVPGTLEVVYVEPGDRITAGTHIAKLENNDISKDVARLSGERDRLQTHFQNLVRRQGIDKDAADAVPATFTALKDLNERLRRRELDEQRLILTANTGGIIEAPPNIPPPKTNDDLPNWSGSPCEHRNTGCYLDIGTLFCIVAKSGKMDALLIVDQGEIEFVRPGLPVDLKLHQYRNQTFHGEVTKVAQIDVDKVPPALSHKTGGELSTITDESGAERPIGAAYQVRVPLPQLNVQLLNGFQGRAKINVGSEPLGRRLIRLIRKTFLF
jgi:putative peptide zinc metalloprotease protein